MSTELSGQQLNERALKTLSLSLTPSKTKNLAKSQYFVNIYRNFHAFRNSRIAEIIVYNFQKSGIDGEIPISIVLFLYQLRRSAVERLCQHKTRAITQFLSSELKKTNVDFELENSQKLKLFDFWSFCDPRDPYE